MTTATEKQISYIINLANNIQDIDHPQFSFFATPDADATVAKAFASAMVTRLQSAIITSKQASWLIDQLKSNGIIQVFEAMPADLKALIAPDGYLSIFESTSWESEDIQAIVSEIAALVGGNAVEVANSELTDEQIEEMRRADEQIFTEREMRFALEDAGWTLFTGRAYGMKIYARKGSIKFASIEQAHHLMMTGKV